MDLRDTIQLAVSVGLLINSHCKSFFKAAKFLSFLLTNNQKNINLKSLGGAKN